MQPAARVRSRDHDKAYFFRLHKIANARPCPILPGEFGGLDPVPAAAQKALARPELIVIELIENEHRHEAELGSDLPKRRLNGDSVDGPDRRALRNPNFLSIFLR